jgi:hypothetical protein
MREQVRLAFYGIDATRIEVESGRMPAAEGERIIDSFERTHGHRRPSLRQAAARNAATNS